LCKELNINYEYVPIQECETYKYLKQFRVRKNDIQPHEILDEKILNQFKPIPIQSWIEEGINIDTQRKYEVRFDDKSNRIVFPIRDEFGNLINIKGRTCYKNYKDLGVKKYIHYYPVGIPDYLFGLHYNKPSILKKGEIIIFEAEKSVFKCDSLGIYNVVAAGTHFITDYQIPKLLQLHCNIVIAFDNDVEHKELMKQVDKIKRYTNVYIVQDKVGLLGEKDAPIDKGINIWQQLYDEKVRIV
jgi:DNA primase